MEGQELSKGDMIIVSAARRSDLQTYRTGRTKIEQPELEEMPL